MKIAINVNQTVYFTLSPRGAEIWRQKYPGTKLPTSAQLWNFMTVFGEAMKWGSDTMVVGGKMEVDTAS